MKRALVNIGNGEDLEIGELALLIKEIIGFRGTIQHDLPSQMVRPGNLWMFQNFMALAGNIR